MAAFDPLRLLEALVDHDVEFIVIGQIAAVLQGHPETTVDLDILPKQALVNAERLADALRSVDAADVLQRTDDAEPLGVDDQDFVGWRDVRSFDTAAGRIDVIPVAAGIGTFDDNRDSAMEIDLDGFAVLVAARRRHRFEGSRWATAGPSTPTQPVCVSRATPRSRRGPERAGAGVICRVACSRRDAAGVSPHLRTARQNVS